MGAGQTGKARAEAGAEAAVLEMALHVSRGGFHLDIECSFASNWTVIFGPSGAGKSTLLRVLAGLELAESSRRQSVRVVLDGETLTDSVERVWLKPGRRKASLVSQQPALFPHLSVEANVGYGLKALDRSARLSRVAEMLELVGGAGLQDRRPGDLSGGEAQRIALARALAPRPRLLLLDEPLSALDGVASDALLLCLQGWARESRTQVVMATHDASDALASGAEVALLHDGRMAALGPAAEVLAAERVRLLSRLGFVEKPGAPKPTI
jgi:ABC-type sulfate/molybdate transport systems ATPase subunit